MHFAAIADDFTGGSDLAGMLRAQGVATVQLFGLPTPALVAELHHRYQAVVLSLKSRSIEPDEACRLSLAAVDALAPLAPRQWAFKYCSTFDSTPRGNIGPVTDALLRRLGVDFTVAVPALPVNGRTQYLGHLFVNGVPLHESPLKDHPLNPMTDANLVRWLARQTTREVGLIPLPDVQAAKMKPNGEIALVDAVSDSDLHQIAAFVEHLPLITGGSGLAAPLARRWQLPPLALARGEKTAGATLVLSGSCSAITLRQLALLHQTNLCQNVPLHLDAVHATIDQAATLLRQGQRVLISTSAPATQRLPDAAASIEHAFGALAQALVAHTSNLIVAGGETSGAVVEALALPGAEVEAILAPGVPALRTLGARPLRLALKSGNFGGENFFADTIRYLES